jgi:hypothetical protein
VATVPQMLSYSTRSIKELPEGHNLELKWLRMMFNIYSAQSVNITAKELLTVIGLLVISLPNIKSFNIYRFCIAK